MTETTMNEAMEELKEQLHMLGSPESKEASSRWGWASNLIVYLFKQNCKRLIEIDRLRKDLHEVRTIALRAGRDTPRIHAGSVDTQSKTSKNG